MYIYEVWRRKDGKLLARGTEAECAVAMGWPKGRVGHLSRSAEPKAKKTRNAIYKVTRVRYHGANKQALYYAVYLRKEDRMVVSGTSRECAAALGTSLNGFHSLVSKVQSGKNKKWEIYKEPYYTEEEIA